MSAFESSPGEPPTRWIVMSCGRSGTTLLAAILSAAGADFGVPHTEIWDERSGDFERPDLERAANHARRAEYALPFKRAFLVANWLVAFRRSRAKRILRKAFSEFEYCKSDGIWLPFIDKIGYRPIIIVCNRDFRSIARSRYLLSKRDYLKLSREYLATFRNSLLFLDVYGGCVIDYDDIVDPAQTEWARALATVTSLEAETLLAKRDAIARAVAEPPTATIAVDAEASALNEHIKAMRNHVVQPSRQYLRTIKRRRATKPADETVVEKR